MFPKKKQSNSYFTSLSILLQNYYIVYIVFTTQPSGI